MSRSDSFKVILTTFPIFLMIIDVINSLWVNFGLKLFSPSLKICCHDVSWAISYINLIPLVSLGNI